MFFIYFLNKSSAIGFSSYKRKPYLALHNEAVAKMFVKNFNDYSKDTVAILLGDSNKLGRLTTQF